ncbi:class I SAM-dependent methyltransferase [Parageobacillus toebii]|uniref:class I SAM-dependent methyltransferase n=1 Tax=Parageobacillus toebii TaxID=153151 RepID=UPI003B82E874
MFIQGFFTSLLFDFATFDHVTFDYHLDSTKKKSTFHRKFRILKPGGEVHIADLV